MSGYCVQVLLRQPEHGGMVLNLGPGCLRCIGEYLLEAFPLFWVVEIMTGYHLAHCGGPSPQRPAIPPRRHL
jgi:hypothetical protein